jgi:MSHA biogenesis protein MshQ
MELVIALGGALQRRARLVLFALALCLANSTAWAQITINSVLVNGSTSTIVAPGATVLVSVTATVSSNTWRRTQISTSPTSSVVCYSQNSRGRGTHTVYFNYTAPSAPGLYSVRVIAYRRTNCNNPTSPTFTLSNAINTGANTLNHVRLEHDGAGQICAPKTVTLRACANATCTTLYTNNVTVSLGTSSGTWSSSPLTFTGGTATPRLTKTTAGTATMSGSVTAPGTGSPALQCYLNGVPGSCAINFGNASCTFDAVETAALPGTDITIRRAGNPVTLDVLTLAGGAVSNGLAATVTAVLVDASGGGCTGAALSNSVAKDFVASNNGRQSYTFTPTAAARNVRVKVSTPSQTGCSTDNFAIRPVAFSITASGAGADATGASASNGPVLKAGSTRFTLNASSATGYNGVPEINALRLEAADVDVGEPGGAGTISGSFSAGAGTGGVATGTAFTYSEVGYFRMAPFAIYDEDFGAVDAVKGDCFGSTNLGTDDPVADPNVAVGGMLGCYFGSAATPYLGRFIPDHFAMTLPSLVNRSALTACTAPGFTYMGEAMQVGFTLTAQNAADETTSNYTGKFARINPATQSGLAGVNDAAVRTPFPACGSTPAHPCLSVGAATIVMDEGEAEVVLPLTVLRGSTPVGAFASFKVGIAPVDQDSVTLATADYDIDTVNGTAGAPNHQRIGSTDVRYGRLAVSNSYGSELLKLPMPVAAQYWNGTTWTVNTLDSCTPIPASAFTLTNYVPGITTSNLPAAALTGSAVLASGKGNLLLARPSPPPATKGSVQVNSTIPYLPGAGRATFGVYKSGPVIYTRETY